MVVAAVTFSLVFLALIGLIAQDAINNSAIPNEEYGVVVSKAPMQGGHIADYMVSLANGKTLYILSNTTLYDSIEVNFSYLFNCRIDLNNQITIVNSATQVNRTIT